MNFTIVHIAGFLVGAKNLPNKYIDELFGDKTVSRRVILDYLSDFHGATRDEIEYANSLIPEAGEYLGRCLGKFVRAEMTDEVARKEIFDQKLLVGRLCEIFPSILGFMRLAERAHAQNVLNIVHDCVSDFQSVTSNGRKDANQRKAKATLTRAHKSVSEIISQLQDVDAIGLHDFDQMLRLYRKHVNDDDNVKRSLGDIQRDIEFLSHYLEYAVYCTDHDPDFIRVPDNQAKTHIVECAYYLTSAWGGPTFVTTPGSDFSAVCGLIFEIATGVPDESFAGAINRFARSKGREEEDQHWIDYGPEWEIARDHDNFFDVKEAAVKFQKEIAELRAALHDPFLPQNASVLMGVRLLEAIKSAEDNDRRHGPFIMWASQIKADWTSELGLMDEIRATQVRLDILLGRRRRNESKST